MSTLADRLLAASGRLFVGRKKECTLFSQALNASELPFSVIHIHGPGGVGKTSLLFEFRRMCRALDIPAYYIDARSIHSDSSAYLEALNETVKASGEEQTSSLGGLPDQRQVLLIDTFELLTSIEQWLFNTFFCFNKCPDPCCPGRA